GVSRVEVLGGVERGLVVSGWNETGVSVGAGSVVELFEGWVVGSSGVVAVRCGGDAVSYKVLGERVDRLAWFLRGLGVGREVLVGLCLPRGVDMVTAVLAV